jgi:hypothetical protein
VNEEALRLLVREAIARRTGIPDPTGRDSAHHASHTSHASHAVYGGLVNTTGACLIEPAVPCNHCNYCKSHGH